MQLYTTTLTSGSISISSINSVLALSVLAEDSSECTIKGSIPFQGVAPTDVSLINGDAFTQTASSPQSPLDGITITWVSGTIKVAIGF